MEIGDRAPQFALADKKNKIHKLSDYAGSWVLIYFYPKDFTPGCTSQACSLRDSFPNFKSLNIKVLGISTDSVESHRQFSEKYKLPFTILSDSGKKAVNLYGVWGLKKFLGREFWGTKRTSFLINPEGKIVKIYEGVKPATHAQEVLKDLQEIKTF